MKVDLEKVTLGHSPITDSVFAGTLVKPGLWKNKKDVTNEFIGCVISRWEGHKEIISSGNSTWEISVKKISPKNKK